MFTLNILMCKVRNVSKKNSVFTIPEGGISKEASVRESKKRRQCRCRRNVETAWRLRLVSVAFLKYVVMASMSPLRYS